MYILFFLLCFSSLARSTEVVSIDLVTDIAISDPNSELDLVTGLMIFIGEQLQPNYKLNLIEGSRKREWRQLTESDNVCLYNKVKTPERQAMAQFSKYPLATFPANRLVINKQMTSRFISSEPLKEAITEHKLKIGITHGRAYGEYIDNLINRYGFLFIKGEGQTSAQRQRKMLMKGRLDGVIEYSTVFTAEFPPEQIDSQIAFIEIENTPASIFGFIACSNSIIGKQIIHDINQVMSQTKVQRHIIEAHKKVFVNVQEQTIITKEFNKAFMQ